MANKLKVQEVEAIRNLTALGWGIRRIARQLGVSRNTVRQHVRTAPSAGGAVGAISKSPTFSTPGAELQIDPLSTAGINGRKSLCLDHAAVILQKVEAGLSAQRIYQDLKVEGPFAGLVGPPGLGKSHLAQAIGYHIIKAGFQVVYCSIFDLVQELQADQSPAELHRTLARYLKPDLLVVDDMGLKVLPPKSGEALFEIVMRRYENRSTLMTSNRPIEEWGKLLNDVPAATAILDRFLHHAEIIQMKGKSYRLRNAGRSMEAEGDHSGLPAGKKK